MTRKTESDQAAKQASSDSDQESDKESDKTAASRGKFAVAARIGSEFIAAPLVGVFLGIFLQNQWPQLKPWGLIVGFLLGVSAGFYTIYKTATGIEEQNRKRRKNKVDQEIKNQWHYDDEDEDEWR